MTRTSPVLSPYQLFRPFIWVAALAFLAGFAGFLLLGRGAFAEDAPRFEPPPPAPMVAHDPFAKPNPMRIA
jgi:hypothetical protein